MRIALRTAGTRNDLSSACSFGQTSDLLVPFSYFSTKRKKRETETACAREIITGARCSQGNTHVISKDKYGSNVKERYMKCVTHLPDRSLSETYSCCNLSTEKVQQERPFCKLDALVVYHGYGTSDDWYHFHAEAKRLVSKGALIGFTV